jgi:N-acetylglucosaminyldiphosphoundecaprenol N-acetyl-beta-D-mannosaminyltransferase
VIAERIDVGGVTFDALSELEAVERIVDRATAGDGGWVLTPNLDIVRQFNARPEIRTPFLTADLVLADGMPVIWASRAQGTPLPERVAGSSLIWSVSRRAAGAGLGVFLLGGNPGAADAASQRLREEIDGLDVVGTHCPPFGFEQDADALAQIDRQLDASRPAIAFVGLGFPKQEHLIQRLRARHPAIVFLGVGISLSFAAGELARAPRWMQAAGLEWVHRLVQEPGRLARRYLIDGLPFAAVLIGRAVMRRFAPRTVRPVLADA